MDLKPFPELAIICGIGYRIQEREGLISFREDGGIFGVETQMAFQRADDGGGQGCWYVSLHCTYGKIMVSHIVKAYELVKKYRGDNWGEMPKEGSG